MLVKYVGHGDMFSADWDSKRYVFCKRRPISDIPEALYNFIKSSQFICKDDVIFYEQPVDSRNDNKIVEEKKIVDKINISSITRKRGRPKK
jgi:hypothetical protein